MAPLLITTGDPDGIGLEITQKSLKKQPIPNSRPLFIFVSKGAARNWRRLGPRFKSSVIVSSLADAHDAFTQDKVKTIIIEDTRNPALWVEEAAQYCYETGSALVTAPLSKTLILKSGLKDIGHTDILKRVTGSKNVYMTFLGTNLRVLLGSGHIPLSEVPAYWNRPRMNFALTAALKLRKALNLKKPIGVLGLNPHAGESGLLGREEKTWLNQVLRATRNVDGPLVPDAAFKPKLRDRYSIFVALYHDQGLIPFKTLHGDSGVHISWGLPFVRTSVDHGTAKDIFGKNKANPQSMIDALKWAHKLEKKGVE